MDIMAILQNQYVMWSILGILVFGLTELAKIPIKSISKKLGDNNRIRVNAVIVLLSLGFGVLLYYLYCLLVFKSKCNPVNGLQIGAITSSVYEVVTRLIGKKVENPYKTIDGDEVLTVINEAAKDGNITKDEVKEIVNTAVDTDDVLSKEETEKLFDILNNKK